MQIVVILGFAMTLTVSELESPLGPASLWFVPALAVYLAGVVLLKGYDTSLALRVLGQIDRGRRPSLTRAVVVSAAAQGWLVLGSAAAVLLGLGDWVRLELGLGGVPLLARAAVVTPFLLAIVIYWLLEYPSHRAVRLRAAEMERQMGRAAPPVWSLGQYLAFNLRHQVLFVAVPVALIIFLVDCVALYVQPAVIDHAWGEALVVALTLAAALAVFLIAPLLIVHIWKTRPLPDGPIRRAMEDLCRLMGLRYRRLLVWHSEGVVANAGVMGIIAPVRYVLMSDGLLDSMHPEQIQSIFAHEAGHIVNHHILHALVFAVATVLASQSLATLLDAWLDLPLWASVGASLALLMAFWAGGFGWLSRRFERQCDTLAAWTAGPDPALRDRPDQITPEGAATFASALDEVARLNHVTRTARNWRHGTIAWRVDYILHLGATRGSRRPIDRLVRRIKIGLWLALAASIALSVAVYVAVPG